MTTLPGLKKGITKDPSPPATDTQVSPITIPNGTTILTTKLHNEIVDNEDQIIDYISGDASPDFIPQNAIDSLSTDLSNKQPLDADLTSIAGLVPSNDDIIQRKTGVWTSRTPIQFKVDLALVKADVGLSNVDNTSDADKPVSTAQQTALDLKEDTANKGAISGYAGLDALQKLLLANFPSGNALEVLMRNAANDALEFGSNRNGIFWSTVSNKTGINDVYFAIIYDRLTLSPGPPISSSFVSSIMAFNFFTFEFTITVRFTTMTTDLVHEIFINLATGNQTVTIPGSFAGVVTDTTNTDTLSAGDSVSIRMIENLDTGTIAYSPLAIKYREIP